MRPLLVAAAFVTVYLWNASTVRHLHSERRAGRDARTDGAIAPGSPAERDGADAFVVDEAALARLKSRPPTVVDRRADPDYRREFAADVVSVGSTTRLDYLRGQVETWASHVDVRNFWGFAEPDDYDANCKNMTKDQIDAYLHTCRTPHDGWEDDIEKFATNRYGETENGLRHEGGWICAQRRVGRALGWVHDRYQSNNTMLPDVLILVDDDTSLDIGNLKKMIVQEVGRLDQPDGSENKGPLVYAGCYYPKTRGLDLATSGWPFATPHGGFGTYFNKHALRILTRPIFCNGGDRQSSKEKNGACINLKQNRIGERRAFRPGISVLELFYQYSALREFCFHSDWLVGYMINYYLYPQAISAKQEILRVNPPLCGNVTDRRKIIYCTEEYTTCHRQTPETMEHWAIAAFVKSPGSFGKVPHLAETEFVMGNLVPKG